MVYLSIFLRLFYVKNAQEDLYAKQDEFRLPKLRPN